MNFFKIFFTKTSNQQEAIKIAEDEGEPGLLEAIYSNCPADSPHKATIKSMLSRM